MKTPDAIGGTDAQQQEYAAKVRTIRADQLGDAHMGRLVSLAGHPPRRLADTRAIDYRLDEDGQVAFTVLLLWSRTTSTAVPRDTPITIHPEA